MIIDRHTFIDLATHLEGASEGVLDVTRRCVAVCEEGLELSPESRAWLGLVDALVAVNLELTAIEQTLRALLEANREEEDHARAAARAGRCLNA